MYFLTGPSPSRRALCCHHAVTQTWIPEDNKTTCHPGFYSNNPRLGDHIPWPWSLTRNIKFDENPHDPPTLPPSPQLAGCKGGAKEKKAAGWRWSGRTGSGEKNNKNPAWLWNCEATRGGLVSGAQKFVNRQSCSSRVSMATISGPTQVLVEVFCFSRGSD